MLLSKPFKNFNIVIRAYLKNSFTGILRGHPPPHSSSMNATPIQIKRVLLSVSDKNGIVEFAKGLHALGVEILSTGGTAKALRDAGIAVRNVSDVTGFPEMMDGRVKTLHPKIHAGILGLRDTHAHEAETNDIQWIDLVVVNLYPFAETIQQPNVTEDEAIENIDIGGPSLIRAAAKNVGWVGAVVDPTDYAPLLRELQAGGLSYETRKKLSAKAFSHTAQYDAIIHQYFEKSLRTKTQPSLREENGGERRSALESASPPSASRDDAFPDTFNLAFTKRFELRYGENPHQSAAAYANPLSAGPSILNAKIHQGKQLSYNNIMDADAAFAMAREFNEPACIVVKHANPCGVATGTDITEVFTRAYNADSLSAFGGIIALNRPCTAEIAEAISKVFAEIVLAPSYEKGALEILAKKKNLRVLELGDFGPREPKREFRYVDGGLLLQDADSKTITRDDLKIVTKKHPAEKEILDMLFAWKVVKHIKANAILLAKDNTTVGVGAGQVSRVDSVDIALKKAGDRARDAVLASDAFFPFRDSIDKLAGTGIAAIIQPGGSQKDETVIAAANEQHLAMVFTGVRVFKH